MLLLGTPAREQLRLYPGHGMQCPTNCIPADQYPPAASTAQFPTISNTFNTGRPGHALVYFQAESEKMLCAPSARLQHRPAGVAVRRTQKGTCRFHFAACLDRLNPTASPWTNHPPLCRATATCRCISAKMDTSLLEPCKIKSASRRCQLCLILLIHWNRSLFIGNADL